MPQVQTLMPLRRSFKTSLRYTDYVTFDAGAGLASTRVYSVNSLFDPDVTGVGHQPRGFDQIIAMYNYYRVTSAKIFVDAVGGPTATGQPCILTLSASRDAAPYSASIYDYTEQPNVTYEMMSGDASAKVKLSLSADPSKMIGSDADQLFLIGTSAASPNTQVYFHVSQLSSDLSAENPGPISLIVTIVYDVEFTAPIDPPSS